MGRFANPYENDDCLPEGMKLTGYDADEGRRYYADEGRRYYVDMRNGSTWVRVGAPYAEYGVLTCAGNGKAKSSAEATDTLNKTTPKEDQSRKRAAKRSRTLPIPPKSKPKPIFDGPSLELVATSSCSEITSPQSTTLRNKRSTTRRSGRSVLESRGRDEFVDAWVKTQERSIPRRATAPAKPRPQAPEAESVPAQKPSKVLLIGRRPSVALKSPNQRHHNEIDGPSHPANTPGAADDPTPAEQTKTKTTLIRRVTRLFRREK